MKKVVLLFALFTLSCLVIRAQGVQEIDHYVIASAGDYHEYSQGSLSWTLGEPVVETVTNSSINLILTQGFQQPERDTAVFVREILAHDIHVNLYPNPTVQSVRLDMKYDNTSEIKIELVDLLGRVLHEDELEVAKGQMNNYHLDVSTLAAGMYLFRLTDEGQLINTYKFQKVGY